MFRYDHILFLIELKIDKIGERSLVKISIGV